MDRRTDWRMRQTVDTAERCVRLGITNHFRAALTLYAAGVPLHVARRALGRVPAAIR